MRRSTPCPRSTLLSHDSGAAAGIRGGPRQRNLTENRRVIGVPATVSAIVPRSV
jgi:hypothetical protein